MTDIGSGQVQDRHKQRLGEIIAALNSLFEGELTEADTVSFFETIKAKMIEAPILRAQAAANSREQFGNSPRLQEELLKSIIDAMAAHESMSKQALNSEGVRAGILALLLGHGELWESLRAA